MSDITVLIVILVLAAATFLFLAGLDALKEQK
jgi:hypothetical protein